MKKSAKKSAAEILREYGPFPGVDEVHGVTYDGKRVWFASGDKLSALDPASGNLVDSLKVPAHAGTAFDGRHLYQIAEARIQKIDPKTGRVLATTPAATQGSPGPKGRSGSGSTGSARSIRSIPRRARSSAPSSPIASSPASPGSTASSGTPPGRATRASCGASTRKPAKSWSGSRCHQAPASRVSNPTAATGSSAAAATPERCAPCAGRSAARSPRQIQAHAVETARTQHVSGWTRRAGPCRDIPSLASAWRSHLPCLSRR